MPELPRRANATWRRSEAVLHSTSCSEKSRTTKPVGTTIASRRHPACPGAMAEVAVGLDQDAHLSTQTMHTVLRKSRKQRVASPRLGSLTGLGKSTSECLVAAVDDGLPLLQESCRHLNLTPKIVAAKRSSRTRKPPSPRPWLLK